MATAVGDMEDQRAAWLRAADEAVPWERFRDEVRGQTFFPPDERDIAPPSREEAIQLARRRAEVALDLTSRVAVELQDMHAALEQGDEEALPAALLRVTQLDYLDADNHHGGGVGELWGETFGTELAARRWIASSAPLARAEDFFFISHAWDDDGDSNGLEGVATHGNIESLAEFARRKAVALQNVVRSILELQEAEGGARLNRSAFRFWLDKSSIPQFEPRLRTACVAHLESFVGLSSGLVILLNSRYIRRLWSEPPRCKHVQSVLLLSHAGTLTR
mmetsp:Transcript_5358/g.14707  ORF Transcript_5358/g.14707 Transcript_5358/m.14707 type:complete len:277 (-) Transcript_5358:961-1791(-)